MHFKQTGVNKLKKGKALLPVKYSRIKEEQVETTKVSHMVRV